MDEIDIVRMAHTTAVVMVPGLGDDIQAIKAGILEIADVFVVNKADRDGADRTAKDLSVMLEMGSRKEGDWLPKVMKTEASRGVGIEELVAEFENHRQHLFSTDRIHSFIREKNGTIFSEMLKDRLFTAVFSRIHSEGRFDRTLDGICSKSINPYAAVEELLGEFLNLSKEASSDR